jgi:hypothetical protein
VLAGIEALTIFAKTADASANVRAVREYQADGLAARLLTRPKAGDELNDALTA